MALNFYNRYVPPSTSQSQSVSLSERPAKKRKVDIKSKREKVGQLPDAHEAQKHDFAQQTEKNENLSHVNGDLDPERRTPEKRKKKHSERQGVSKDSVNPKSVAPQASPPAESVVNHDKAADEGFVSSLKDSAKSGREKKRRKKGSGERTEDDTDKSKPAERSTEETHEKHKGVLSRYAQATETTATETILASSEEAARSEPQPEFHGLEPLPQPAPAEEGPRASVLAALPQWLREPTTVASSASVPFANLSLRSTSVDTLTTKGFKDALAIQSAVIPLLQGSKRHDGDLCISAATGSGKTLAYALPLVEALREKHGHRLRGLIVVPTRELVAQAKETLDMLTGDTGLQVATAVGSKTMVEEQTALMTERVRYDPQQYRIEQAKVIDEDQELMNWDFDDIVREKSEVIPDHVVQHGSKVDILICTPGRLVEHLKSTKGFTLEHIQWLVIDEADRLLDESFQDWVDTVIPELEYMPTLSDVEHKLQMGSPFNRQRIVQKVILSATMTKDVGKLVPLKLRRPKLVVMEGNSVHAGQADDEGKEALELPDTLIEYAVPIEDSSTKPLGLLKIMETPLPDTTTRLSKSTSSTQDPGTSDTDYTSDSDSSSSSTSSSSSSSISNTKTSQPTPSPPLHGTLIFTRDNENALRLSRLLSLLRPTLAPFISTLTKSTTSTGGRKTLTRFQKDKLSILVASDRASRGLDIPNLARVINYDVPSSLVSYVHRVGRTARAGREGVAITLVEGHQARWFWNEVARTERVGRGREGGESDGKVRRWNLDVTVGEAEMGRYENAIKQLGDEAMGKKKDNAEEENGGERGEKAKKEGKKAKQVG